MSPSNPIRNACMVCGSQDLHEIINLGLHSFADRFVPKSSLKDVDPAYPLICDLCTKCGQIQLRYPTSPSDRYCTVDYSYTSANSAFSREHWIDYAKAVSKETGLSQGDLVIEAGSNDGFLTEQFALGGAKVLGVDPSGYMADLAKNRGVETIVSLFDTSVAQQIKSKHGQAKIIVANNVFNHSENPVDFAKAAASLLQQGGYFVFELPYWAIGVKAGKFDQIYHEHVSYLTAKSSASILERAGLSISKIEVVNYHGGSLRVYSQLKSDLPEHSSSSLTMISEEEKSGLFSPNTYSKFMNAAIKQRSRFLQVLHKLKAEGKTIIAVGAPAKGNTFLNFYKLDGTLIDYATDSSPHKQGKYTPLSRIPIVGDEIFKNYDSPYALILSWNIADQLKKVLSPINPNIQFISPEQFA